MWLDNSLKTCLLGGAIAEAYGHPFKGDVISTSDRWKCSAPTQLTIATCEALMESGSVSVEKIEERLLWWFRRGRLTGLDPITYRSLQIRLLGDNAGLADQTPGPPNNGAALRVAPLAFLTDPTQPKDQKLIKKVVSITHQSEEAYAGALAIVLAMRFMLNDRQNLFGHLLRHLPETEVKNRLVKISQEGKASIREIAHRYGASSKVEESVPLAIFSAVHIPEIGYRPMIKALVASGGDTNSNCSLAAQMGSLYAEGPELPADWRKRFSEVHFYEQFEEITEKFVRYVREKRGIKTLF